MQLIISYFFALKLEMMISLLILRFLYRALRRGSAAMLRHAYYAIVKMAVKCRRILFISLLAPVLHFSPHNAASTRTMQVYLRVNTTRLRLYSRVFRQSPGHASLSQEKEREGMSAAAAVCYFDFRRVMPRRDR